MHRSKKKRNIVIFSLVGVLLCMGIGYAAFNTELKISGTSKVTSNWDIEITNVTPGTPTGSAENTVAPKWDALTASMEADLYEKGDAMEYDVTIENKGTIDAKLNNILTNLENSNSEAVNITFSGYTKGEILKSKAIKVIHVKIEYNPNYEGGETSSEVEIDFDYGQNNDETSPPENTHLVKYDCITNGGNDCSSNNEYLVSGTPVDLSKTGTKDNYDFVGWNTDSKATEALTELTVTDTDITLYAIFRAKDTTPPIIDNISTTSTTNSITAVVAAHDDESGISKYEFSINNGEYVDNGNNNTYKFTNLSSNTTYNIKVRVTNGVGLQGEKKTNDMIDITDDITTTGDGLYEDEYEDDRYVYRGKNPNNYVSFNNELWRIIAKETDGSIKIVKSELVQPWRPWDESNSNDWTRPATLNQYLNREYLSSITKDQEKIANHQWYIGAVSASNTDLKSQINAEKSKKYTNKIGLISQSDYIRANSDQEKCGTNNANISTNINCMETVWLYYPGSFWWTLSKTENRLDSAWYVADTGYSNYSNEVTATSGIRPSVYLSSTTIFISGNGTQSNPYILDNGVSTSTLNNPTFSESGTNPKIVTITYPEGCDSNLTCTYQKDNGEEIIVNSSTINVSFTNDGTLIAKVSDNINTVSSSYYVTIGIDLTDNVVSSGDGLYKDEYEEGRYIYKGTNPNNYIRFNNELWRIISKEADGTYKIIRNESIGNMAWDSNSSNDWTKPATLNNYLNDTYLKSLSESNIIAFHNWPVGGVILDNSDLSTEIENENEKTWNGHIGLFTVSEYIRANSNKNQCKNLNSYNSNRETCQNTNWIYEIVETAEQNDIWTISAIANSSQVFTISKSNGGIQSFIGGPSGYGGGFTSVIPVLYISSDILLNGFGTKENPYIIINKLYPPPTYIETGINPKNVTINYPDGCGYTLKCTYKKNNDEVTNVTSNNVNLEFTTSGSIIATVSYGDKTVSSTYTVKFGNADDLRKSAVTEGDGLYKDEHEEGRYIYKGTNPDNYINFNNETWRILSVETDNSIKIIKNDALSPMYFNTNSSNNWDAPVSLNTYLNSTYLSTLSDHNKIISHDWNIGKVDPSNNNIIDNISREKAKIWNGKIGLVTASEYIRANSNKTDCETIQSNNDNKETCAQTNWLYSDSFEWWTITPVEGFGRAVFHVLNSSGMILGGDNKIVNETKYNVRPVIYLSPSIQMVGSGTKRHPYTIKY